MFVPRVASLSGRVARARVVPPEIRHERRPPPLPAPSGQDAVQQRSVEDQQPVRPRGRHPARVLLLLATVWSKMIVGPPDRRLEERDGRRERVPRRRFVYKSWDAVVV